MIDGTIGYEYRWCLCSGTFLQICTIFTNLTHFHFDLKKKQMPMYNIMTTLPSECYSSSIVHLNIQVKTFDDCLWLLDGHFSQLHTLIVHVEHIHNTSRIINNKVKYFKS